MEERLLGKPISALFAGWQTGFFYCEGNGKLHKSTKNCETRKFLQFFGGKVIHNQKGGFIGKNELYTKLCTLSTENATNFEVYIVKKSNGGFVQIR